MEPIVGGIEERDVEWSSSDPFGGRGGALEGLGDGQEEISGETTTTSKPVEEMARVAVVAEETMLLVAVAQKMKLEKLRQWKL